MSPFLAAQLTPVVGLVFIALIKLLTLYLGFRIVTLGYESLILGIQGKFDFGGQVTKNFQFKLLSTSPGLLFLLLGVGLMGWALYVPKTVTTPGVAVGSVASDAAPAPAALAASADVTPASPETAPARHAAAPPVSARKHDGAARRSAGSLAAGASARPAPMLAPVSAATDAAIRTAWEAGDYAQALRLLQRTPPALRTVARDINIATAAYNVGDNGLASQTAEAVLKASGATAQQRQSAASIRGYVDMRAHPASTIGSSSVTLGGDCRNQAQGDRAACPSRPSAPAVLHGLGPLD